MRNAVNMFWTWSLGLCVVAGCSAANEAPAAEEVGREVEDAPAAPTAGSMSAAGVDQADLVCTPSERMDVAGRASPYDSVLVSIGGAEAKICYGRPYAKGRTIFGGLVPHGEIWRTGANEPTIIHLPVAAEIAGIAVEPGAYSLYTVPGPNEWEVIVNRSTSQWGHESQYTDAVRAQEVGRATVPAETTDAPVEQFTIRAAPDGAGSSDLLLEWENTRVRIPIERS